MPDRSRKRPQDLNQLAVSTVEDAAGQARLEDAKGGNPAAVELGRLGGKKDGKARAVNLSPEQRREIARLPTRAWWSNH